MVSDTTIHSNGDSAFATRTLKGASANADEAPPEIRDIDEAGALERNALGQARTARMGIFLAVAALFCSRARRQSHAA